MVERTVSRHVVRRRARKSAKRIKGLQKEARTYTNETLKNIVEMELANLDVGAYDAIYVRGPRKHVFRYRVVAVPLEEQPEPTLHA